MSILIPYECIYDDSNITIRVLTYSSPDPLRGHIVTFDSQYMLPLYYYKIKIYII